MNTCFECYAPPGDAEFLVVHPSHRIVAAQAKVAMVMIIHGIECQPFQREPHNQIPEILVTRPKWTDLPGLPSGKVLFKNPHPDPVLCRIRLQVEETPAADPPKDPATDPE